METERVSDQPSECPATSGLELYDYTHQAWVIDGRYIDCNHPSTMNCQCFGRLHQGEPVDPSSSVH